MVPTDWSRLLCLVGRRKRLIEWKSLLGTSFEQVKVCLLKTGDHVRAIECSLCSCNHEVVPDKDGNGFVAHCRCDDRGCEDILLTRPMAEAWEFSGKTLAETLGQALGVSPGFCVRDGERGLFDLGECPRHPERGHVWLCAGSERVLPERIADLFQRKGVGCVVAANKASALPSLSTNAGVAIIPVDTAFTCAKDAIRGDCQERCKSDAQATIPRKPAMRGSGTPSAYQVGGKYRIEDAYSRVVTLKTKTVWAVPLFTRAVLEVMLTDTRDGLTSELIYAAAVELHRKRYPELTSTGKGCNSDIVAEKSLQQFFRYAGANGKKTVHGLFALISCSGGKKPTYQFRNGIVKAIGAQTAID